ncbi:MAG: diaminopimelate epimerase [Candidatus Phosphoribacter sp.]
MGDVRQRNFTKGHGTENDFVLVPDPQGRRPLDPDEVRRLADRRAGIGGDGVIRVVPTHLADEPTVRAQSGTAAWFMDYRNADGSISQMCGNGSRVFAAYLIREGLETGGDFAIATRAGVKRVRTTVDGFAVDLGPALVDESDDTREKGFNAVVHVPGAPDLPGLRVHVGNPHTVVLLPPQHALDELDLTGPPQVAPPPADGTNVEFVQLLGPGHLAMRVHERGVGETRSCGTGAVAAAAATRWWEGASAANSEWMVDVPGGRLTVNFTETGTAELAGPAELVADGTTEL